MYDVIIHYLHHGGIQDKGENTVDNLQLGAVSPVGLRMTSGQVNFMLFFFLFLALSSQFPGEI